LNPVRTKNRERTVRYEFGIPEIDDSTGGGVEGGTNLLVTGSASAPKRRLARALVSEGVSEGEGTIYVTTKYPASDILGEYDGYDTDRFGVVDCAGQGPTDYDGDAYVDTASSPDDMTGIGVCVSDILEEFWEEREIDRNRVVLDSVSTLLMYSNLETVFRFLHVFTGRVRSVDGLGVFLLDSDMHDDREYSTLRQLFDGTVEFDRVDGEDRIRITDLGPEPTDWVGF